MSPMLQKVPGASFLRTTTEDQPAGRSLIDWARFHFFDHMKLWFSADEHHCNIEFEDQGNVITLREAFYNEIDQHRIPVEREVVSALAHAPVFSIFICGWSGKAGPSTGMLPEFPSSVPVA